MRNALLSAALLVGLLGCVAAPTQRELTLVNCGDPPVDYHEKIKQDLRYKLYDPFTAEYEFGNPEMCVIYTDGIGGTVVFAVQRYGWRVLVRVNAKNRMGGYGGWVAGYYYFRDGTMWAPTLGLQ